MNKKSLIILIISFLVILPSVLSISMSNGLQLYIPFNQSIGDATGNNEVHFWGLEDLHWDYDLWGSHYNFRSSGYNSVSYGNPIFTEEGLKLDGDDDGANTTFKIDSTSETLYIRFIPYEQNSATNYIGYLIDKKNTSNAKHRLVIWYNSYYNNVICGTQGQTTAIKSVASAVNSADQNIEHEVICVWNGSTKKISMYLDGNYIGQTGWGTVGDRVPAPLNAYFIGGKSPSGSPPTINFNGTIAEVSFRSYIIDINEINKIFKHGTYITSPKSEINNSAHINQYETFMTNYNPNASFKNYSVNIWINSSYDAEDYMSIIGATDTDNIFGTYGFAISLYCDGDENPISYILFNGTAKSNETIWTPGTLLCDDNWHMLTFTYDGLKQRIYRDGVLRHSSTLTIMTRNRIKDSLRIGEYIYYERYQGGIDEVRFYNRTLSLSDIVKLYKDQNASINIFSIEAFDQNNNDRIYNFTANVSGTIYQSNNTGEIIVETTSALVDIIITTDAYNGYVDYSINDWDTSEDLQVYMTATNRIYSVEYFNNISIGSDNFVRNLRYEINYICDSGVTLKRYINNYSIISESIICDNIARYINRTYQHSTEGEYNITFLFSADNEWYGLESFESDLRNPTITNLDFNVTEGFGNYTNASTKFRCTDTYGGNLKYNLTFNTRELFNKAVAQGTTISNNTIGVIKGYNYLYGNCSDPFGTTRGTKSKKIYKGNLTLIDEMANTCFNSSNISSSKVYFDDNSSFYNFKGNKTCHVNFTAQDTTQLRFDFRYSTGDVITRYVDLALEDDNLRVCVNKDAGILHYEQIITALSLKPAILTNLYSNCVVAEDYTRFVYEEQYILKAYTIDSMYYLYTYDDGVKVYLAALDGSKASYYNLEALDFNRNEYDLDLGGDGLTFSKENDILTIYYENIDNDSVLTYISIVRLNTSQTVFEVEETDTPNMFYAYFDYSTLGISDEEILLINLIKTDALGKTTQIKRYFNTLANSGIFTASMAFIISLLLMVFGLTFTVSRLTMGWFGVLIVCAAMGILSLATFTWFTIMLMVMEVIVLVYIFLNLTTINTGSMT